MIKSTTTKDLRKNNRRGNSMNMGNMIIPSGAFNAVKVCAFDLSIQDINKRRKQRLVFHSLNDACNYFGISSRKSLETIIKNKTKVEKNKKIFAIRREGEHFDKELG